VNETIGYHNEKLLILANTYPVPSTKYRETNCVAAVTEQGELRRLFPVPYRLLDGDGKFKKWEWITAQVIKAPNDHRPESHRIVAESITREGQIPTGGQWGARLNHLRPHLVESFSALQARREATSESLGVVGPVELLGLDITEEAEKDWTPAEWARLQQDGLFDSEAVRNRAPLRKLPYKFHYRYRYAGEENRHMLTDWEAGALYWHCVQRYAADWERYFRQKLVEEFGNKDLMFLLGTVHRFPERWLIVSLIYPPQGAWADPKQASLFGSS
jgi:hypothetical protein